VIFFDRFVSHEEMAEFIGAADIYITPYRYEAQVVSGTLAYALGAGKAIISTPYWHAIELLDDRRGALVPFQNPEAIANKTIELLDTPAIRHAMRKRAYTFARDMVWKRVAQGYMETFVRVRSDRMEYPRVQFSARATPKVLDRLPELKLDHVNALTDDTGMLQHAIFTIPIEVRVIPPTTTRARLSSRCCWRIRRELAIKMSTGKQIHGLRISLPVICRSSSTHSIQRPAGFETFSAMIAGGTSR